MKTSASGAKGPAADERGISRPGRHLRRSPTDLADTRFHGYGALEHPSQVMPGGERRAGPKRRWPATAVQLVARCHAFRMGESGGQIGDRGLAASGQALDRLRSRPVSRLRKLFVHRPDNERAWQQLGATSSNAGLDRRCTAPGPGPPQPPPTCCRRRLKQVVDPAIKPGRLPVDFRSARFDFMPAHRSAARSWSGSRT